MSEVENISLKEKVMGALKEVIDPELHIDIVNLGLVYDVEISEERKCTITVTLTTIGCPLADIIFEEIKKTIMPIEGIDEVDVKLVWYPPWDPSKMSRYARIALGIRW
ncbi:metal-sulfur cluster assembly factor [Allofustis seminis]|uniref:metal-sulfur cluster assembly factor n=1 Tax=Allofustis seminis TaxID=166939 RepID=UPI000381E4A4|nr:metal-sulfur cluster assembly factor [Allofustis seminis]